MQQNQKEIILKLLDIIEYAGDREVFANQLLGLCYKKALSDTLTNISEDKKSLYGDDFATTDIEKIKEILSKILSSEEYSKALENATTDIFGEYLESINSILSGSQQTELQGYLGSLNTPQ